MPNRILQERICTSETLAQLTPAEEVFFYRLLVQCDDYGRFDARPMVLRARCYSLQLDRVNDADVANWLNAIEAAGLIQRYTVAGRRYLCVRTWDRYQQTRAKQSKYPPPPESVGTCNQPLADASNGSHMSPETKTRTYPESNTNPEPEDEDGSDSEHQGAPDASSAPSVPPDAVLMLHERLTGARGYDPSPAFLQKVAAKYGQLDLEEEALKMLSWLRGSKNRRKQTCTTAFVLDWLKREVAHGTPAEQPGPRNGRGATRRGHQPGPPADAGEFAAYSTASDDPRLARRAHGSLAPGDRRAGRGRLPAESQ